AVASDFWFSVNGTVYRFESDGRNEITVRPGDYTVVELAAAGYTTTYTGCTVTITNAGATCTITNNDNPTQNATLIVKKVVVGSGAASTFSFVVNGGVAQQFDASGQNVLTVVPGTYTVTEANANG